MGLTGSELGGLGSELKRKVVVVIELGTCLACSPITTPERRAFCSLEWWTRVDWTGLDWMLALSSSSSHTNPLPLTQHRSIYFVLNSHQPCVYLAAPRPPLSLAFVCRQDHHHRHHHPPLAADTTTTTNKHCTTYPLNSITVHNPIHSYPIIPMYCPVLHSNHYCQARGWVGG